MDFSKALGGGVAGACALTLLHRRPGKWCHAPRSGRDRRAGDHPADGGGRGRTAAQPAVVATTLAAEVVSNSLYYSLVGLGSRRHAVRNGLVLGLLGGVGAVVLPKRMGLGEQPGQRTPWTQLMTVAWYTVGGLAAGTAAAALAEGDE